MKHFFTFIFTLGIILSLTEQPLISQEISSPVGFSQEEGDSSGFGEDISVSDFSDNIFLSEASNNQDPTSGGTEDSKLSGLKLKVYPNPTTDFIRIRCDTNLQSQLIVEIYDLVGRRIIRKKSDNSDNNVQVDMQSFQRSAYLLKAYTSDGKYSRTLRIVKY